MPDIEKHKFVCIDCETTGLNVQQDRIIEVAVMCFDAIKFIRRWKLW